jgi:DNA-directed RNA polymerase specialized sigma24 family protein
MISSSSKLSELSPEAFAAFLARLASDPMQAGEAYEEQRQALVEFFECRGVTCAEDLTDEVFNRVARRLTEGEVIDNLPGYCFGVARFIVMEHFRAPEQRRVEWAEIPPLAAPMPLRTAEGRNIRYWTLNAVRTQLRRLLEAKPLKADDYVLVVSGIKAQREVEEIRRVPFQVRW